MCSDLGLIQMPVPGVLAQLIPWNRKNININIKKIQWESTISWFVLHVHKSLRGAQIRSWSSLEIRDNNFILKHFIDNKCPSGPELIRDATHKYNTSVCSYHVTCWANAIFRLVLVVQRFIFNFSNWLIVKTLCRTSVRVL